MSGNDEGGENLEYDQPWNPVSYFEEENETTGRENLEYFKGRKLRVYKFSQKLYFTRINFRD